MARNIVAFVENEEATASEPFDRVIDLSLLQGVQLSFVEVDELAESRTATYAGPPVKTAILAVSLLAFGMARMYSQLMRSSPIHVRVFVQVASAAEWLGRPIEILDGST